MTTKACTFVLLHHNRRRHCYSYCMLLLLHATATAAAAAAAAFAGSLLCLATTKSLLLPHYHHNCHCQYHCDSHCDCHYDFHFRYHSHDYDYATTTAPGPTLNATAKTAAAGNLWVADGAFVLHLVLWKQHAWAGFAYIVVCGESRSWLRRPWNIKLCSWSLISAVPGFEMFSQ